MNEQEIFVEATTLLTRIVSQEKADQLDREIPEDRSCRLGPTLRGTLNPATFENTCVPDLLAGADDLVCDDLARALLEAMTPMTGLLRERRG